MTYKDPLDNNLSVMQKELLTITRHLGILSLPLEIVAQIIRLIHDDDADCVIQTILLVNHYFRDVAIRTPGLWTRLSPDRDPRLFMKRSKSVGLEVDLSNGSGPHYRRFVEMVVPGAERWISLSIPSRYDLGDEDLKWTRDVLRGKTLTGLRVLRIRGDNYLGSLQDFDPLYSSWKMPSLRIIRSNNTLPSIQPASLPCLHLHVGASDSYGVGKNIYLEEITPFLQSAPLLTELSFDIGWFKTVNFRTETEATLPNVKKLRLRVKVWGHADSSLTDFLASLHTPNLSALSVDVTTKFASELTGWISVVFPERNSFWPYLVTLDLSVSYVFRDYDHDLKKVFGTSVPADLLQRIPAVHHLSICADDVFSPTPTDWNAELAHLRTLCFRDCNMFNTRFILAIRRIFEAPGFETLKIHNCKKIDTEAVRKVMPEGKALVSTVDWNADITRL